MLGLWGCYLRRELCCGCLPVWLAGWVAAFRLRVGGPEFLLLFIVVCSFTGLIDCSSLFIVVVRCIAVVYCLRFACLCLFV